MHYALCIMVAFIVGTTMGDTNSYALSKLCSITSCIMSKCTYRIDCITRYPDIHLDELQELLAGECRATLVQPHAAPDAYDPPRHTSAFVLDSATQRPRHPLAHQKASHQPHDHTCGFAPARWATPTRLVSSRFEIVLGIG